MLSVIIVLVIIVAIWWLLNRKTEKMSDAEHIMSILDKVKESRPELYPIETMYVEPNGTSRFMMLNTDTYAGELYDYFPAKK